MRAKFWNFIFTRLILYDFFKNYHDDIFGLMLSKCLFELSIGKKTDRNDFFMPY